MRRFFIACSVFGLFIVAWFAFSQGTQGPIQSGVFIDPRITFDANGNIRVYDASPKASIDATNLNADGNVSTNALKQLTNDLATVKSDVAEIKADVLLLRSNHTNAEPGLFVQGFPIYVTNIFFSVPAISTNGYADAAIIQVDNIASDTNWPSVLLCASLYVNTNVTSYIGAGGYDLSFYSSNITWAASPGSPFHPVDADRAAFLGGITMTNWNDWDTNMWSTVSGQNIGAAGKTNWIAIKCRFPTVAKGAMAWTNNPSAQNVLKLTYQRAKR